MLRLPNPITALRQWQQDRKLQRSLLDAAKRLDAAMATAVTLPGPPALAGNTSAAAHVAASTAASTPPHYWWPATTLAPQPSGWVALPGNVLELRDTGFSIKLSHDPREYMYTLTGPRGATLGLGGDLAGLKALAERLAREHEEFVPRWVR